MIRHFSTIVLLLVGFAAAYDPAYPAYGRLLYAVVKPRGIAYHTLTTTSSILTDAKHDFADITEKQFGAFSTQQQIAYLINLYNYYTIELVVTHLARIKSIRDIGEPWDLRFVPFGGNKVSLNQVEHKMLRKNYPEPRIHFALVCASRSCPDLLPVAYTSTNLDSLLDLAGRRFLSDTTKNKIDTKSLRLSQIFQWYGADFSRQGKGGYKAYIGSVMGIQTKNSVIEFLPYDWNLNHVETAK